MFKKFIHITYKICVFFLVLFWFFYFLVYLHINYDLININRLNNLNNKIKEDDLSLSSDLSNFGSKVYANSNPAASTIKTEFNQTNYVVPSTPVNYQNLTDQNLSNQAAPEGSHGFIFIDELNDIQTGQTRVVALGYGKVYLYNEAQDTWVQKSEYNYFNENYFSPRTSIWPAVKFKNMIVVAVSTFGLNQQANADASVYLLTFRLVNGDIVRNQFGCDNNYGKCVDDGNGANYIYFYGDGAAVSHGSINLAVLENNQGDSKLAILVNDSDSGRGYVDLHVIDDFNFSSTPPQLSNKKTLCQDVSSNFPNNPVGAGDFCRNITHIFSLKNNNNPVFYLGIIRNGTTRGMIQALKVDDYSIGNGINTGGSAFWMVSENVIDSTLNIYSLADFNDSDSNLERYVKMIDSKILHDGRAAFSVSITLKRGGTNPYYKQAALLIILKFSPDIQGLHSSCANSTGSQNYKIFGCPGVIKQGPVEVLKLANSSQSTYILEAGGFTEDGGESNPNLKFGIVFSYTQCIASDHRLFGVDGYERSLSCSSSDYGSRLKVEANGFQELKPTAGTNQINANVIYYSKRLKTLFVANSSRNNIGWPSSTYNLKGIYKQALYVPQNRCLDLNPKNSTINSTNNTVTFTFKGEAVNINSNRNLSIDLIYVNNNINNLILSKEGSKGVFQQITSNEYTFSATFDFNEISSALAQINSSGNISSLQVRVKPLDTNIYSEDQNCKGTLNLGLYLRNCSYTITVDGGTINNNYELRVGKTLNFSISGYSTANGSVSVQITRQNQNISLNKTSNYSINNNGSFNISVSVSHREIEDVFWDLEGQPYILNVSVNLTDRTQCNGVNLFRVSPFSKPRVSGISLFPCNANNDPYRLILEFEIAPSDYPGSRISQILIPFNPSSANNIQNILQIQRSTNDLTYNGGNRAKFDIMNGTISQPYVFNLINGATLESVSLESVRFQSGILGEKLRMNIKLDPGNNFSNISDIDSLNDNLRYAIAILDTSRRDNLSYSGVILGNSINNNNPPIGNASINSFSPNFYNKCNPNLQVTTSRGDYRTQLSETNQIMTTIKQASNGNENHIRSSASPIISSEYIFEANNSNNNNNNNNVTLKSEFLKQSLPQKRVDISGLINSFENSFKDNEKLTINASASSNNVDILINSQISSDVKLVIINNSSNNLLNVNLDDNLSGVIRPLIILCKNCNLFINQSLPNNLFSFNRMSNTNNRIILGYNNNTNNNNLLKNGKRIYVSTNNILLGHDSELIDTNYKYFVGSFIAGDSLYTSRTRTSTVVYGSVITNNGIVARSIDTRNNFQGLNLGNQSICFRDFDGLNGTMPLLHIQYDPWYKIWVEAMLGIVPGESRRTLLGL